MTQNKIIQLGTRRHKEDKGADKKSKMKRCGKAEETGDFNH